MPSGEPKDVEKAILRLLAESDLSLTPTNIAKNTGYSGGYIRKECNRMSKENLLEKEDEGGHPFYSVTEKGRMYLAGDHNTRGVE
ncbi:winged helix-turn-helix domain-containing protein [Halorussus marinus]|uniref:winged helix-turn-helix domain-containing protein n=1 Tax=Halorussus marinus TaxID=2505976 RepID=UPI001FD6F140|nr:winged helix-turn-helix domain-containing protein [Halorussus marinus]